MAGFIKANGIISGSFNLKNINLKGLWIYLHLFFLFNLSFAQSTQLKYVGDSIPVSEGGINLGNAWAGGLNSPIFSETDLNGDGFKDLVCFDKSNYRTSIYLNNKKKDTTSYSFSNFFTKLFPEITNVFYAGANWIMMRDFNCDGLEDLLVGANDIITVYKRNGTNSNLMFEIAYDTLRFNYKGSSALGNVPFNKSDVPEFRDLDSDGDLDYLTHEGASGKLVNYYKNQSVEKYGTCALMKPEFERYCWGAFTEDGANSTITLMDSSSSDCTNFKISSSEATMHAGSCLSVFDIDNDGDVEAVVGDIGSNNVVLLTNEGTKDIAKMKTKDITFPSYDTPVDLEIFPYASFINTNNDSLIDIVFGQMAGSSGSNYKNVFQYLNTGTKTNPYFELRNTKFLQGEMMDFGNKSTPVFVDFNQDGLTDILVGNDGYNAGNIFVSKIAYLKNVGTASKPKFDLINKDLGLFSKFSDGTFASSKGFYPAPIDLDGDGDLDMLLGTYDGYLYHYENTSGSTDNPSFTFKNSKYLNYDGGIYVKPILFDIDNDGKKDLIVGRGDGRITYFKDTSLTDYKAFKLITNSLGSVNLQNYPSLSNGYNSPALLKENGNIILYTGSKLGYLCRFSNIDVNSGNGFYLSDTTFADLYEGGNLSVSIADINNNGLPEFIFGSISGGLSIYELEKLDAIEKKNQAEVTIYPNPNSGKFRIKSVIKETLHYTIYSLQGKYIAAGKTMPEIDIELNNNPEKGVYFISIQQNNNQINHKLIIY